MWIRLVRLWVYYTTGSLTAAGAAVTRTDLQREAGKQFDPHVVEAFLALVPNDLMHMASAVVHEDSKTPEVFRGHTCGSGWSGSGFTRLDHR